MHSATTKTKTKNYAETPFSNTRLVNLTNDSPSRRQQYRETDTHIPSRQSK